MKAGSYLSGLATKMLCMDRFFFLSLSLYKWCDLFRKRFSLNELFLFWRSLYVMLPHPHHLICHPIRLPLIPIPRFTNPQLRLDNHIPHTTWAPPIAGTGRHSLKHYRICRWNFILDTWRLYHFLMLSMKIL